LKTWSNNYKDLSLAFENIVRLKEVEPHSRYLSELSQLGLTAISDPGNLKDKQVEIDSLLNKVSKGYGGTILSVEDGLRKIILHIN